jgi:hypothetical protein
MGFLVQSVLGHCRIALTSALALSLQSKRDKSAGHRTYVSYLSDTNPFAHVWGCRIADSLPRPSVLWVPGLIMLCVWV